MKQAEIAKQITLKGNIIQRKNEIGEIFLEKLINLKKEKEIEKSYVLQNLIAKNFTNNAFLNEELTQFGLNFSKRNLKSTWNIEVLRILAEYLNKKLFNLDEYLIYPKFILRVVIPSSNRKVSSKSIGANLASYHRDSWYSYSKKTINIWVPIYGDNNSAFKINQRYFKKHAITIPNFNYLSYPKTLFCESSRNNIVFSSNKDSNIVIFCGHHLHSTIIPPLLSCPRISMDFRLVHRNDLDVLSKNKSQRPLPYKELIQDRIINNYLSPLKEEKTQSIGKIIKNKSRFFIILNNKYFHFVLKGVRKILYVKRNWKNLFPFFYYK